MPGFAVFERVSVPKVVPEGLKDIRRIISMLENLLLETIYNPKSFRSCPIYKGTLISYEHTIHSFEVFCKRKQWAATKFSPV